MPNYQNGKIYKLVSNLTDKIYIGSTTQSLSQRMGGHRKDYKNKYNIASSILVAYGDAKPILIKKYPCNSREELEAEERVYIEKIKCINKNIPTRTKSEYYQDNKEHILEYQTSYYQDNKEHILEYQTTYKQVNKEQIRKQRQQYTLKNKEYRKHYIYWYHNKHLFDKITPLFSDID